MRVGGPTNRQNYMNSHQKNILASETRKKHKKTLIEHKKMTFFDMCLDEISYDTPYLQVCSEKKSVLKDFFLEKSPVQPLSPASVPLLASTTPVWGFPSSRPGSMPSRPAIVIPLMASPIQMQLGTVLMPTRPFWATLPNNART
jgi:hypothetical protein